MLTNFSTIRKAVKKMGTIDKMATDGTFDNMSKKERLSIMRMREKLDRNLGSISDLSRLPGALFIIDIHKENISVQEAHKLNIPTYGIVDTNSDPNKVDFAIPANDDSSKSVDLILRVVCDAIAEGLEERKALKGTKKDEEEKEEVVEAKKATEEIAGEE
jgi:small subunit ribosomal protein S2